MAFGTVAFVPVVANVRARGLGEMSPGYTTHGPRAKEGGASRGDSDRQISYFSARFLLLVCIASLHLSILYTLTLPSDTQCWNRIDLPLASGTTVPVAPCPPSLSRWSCATRVPYTRYFNRQSRSKARTDISLKDEDCGGYESGRRPRDG